MEITAMADKRFWRIQVFDSLSPLFETTIPASRITSNELDALLRTLTAKHSLDDDEIVNAHLRRRPRKNTSKPHPPRPLDVRWSNSTVLMGTCGENPHVVATAVDEGGRSVRFPALP